MASDKSAQPNHPNSPPPATHIASPLAASVSAGTALLCPLETPAGLRSAIGMQFFTPKNSLQSATTNQLINLLQPLRSAQVLYG